VDPAPDDGRRRRFESLAAEIYEPVQRYLRRRTDGNTAEDVLADVLLVLWRRLDDVPSDAAMAWTFGVSRRCLANRRRSEERQRQLVQRLASTPDIPYQGDGRLDAALLSLPEDDQELLRLWAWEQLPPREIAQVLGITANAASIRLHRATKKLRERMGKDSYVAGHLALRQDKERPR
jgi:RNA polymerase sigma-70 factor (ECF subfamily)